MKYFGMMRHSVRSLPPKFLGDKFFLLFLGLFFQSKNKKEIKIKYNEILELYFTFQIEPSEDPITSLRGNTDSSWCAAIRKWLDFHEVVLGWFDNGRECMGGHTLSGIRVSSNNYMCVAIGWPLVNTMFESDKGKAKGD